MFFLNDYQMERLLFSNDNFLFYEYKLESDFEREIIENSLHIFGANTVYIDIKKRIGDSILSIPDGYLIDFSFASEPRLYIIENELASHDPYKHIGSQLLKFAIGYKASGRKIKQFLLDNITSNEQKNQIVEEGLKFARHRNIDAFLEWLIFDKPIAAIVLIDRNSSELENVLSQLTMETDIIEFQTSISGDKKIHKFTPFNDEVREFIERPKLDVSPEDVDTIVVPAAADGFQSAFLEKNAWWQIRISASMLDRIKYIAAYQISPISAITHFAEVARIEKYKDTNKYILYFKDKATKIEPIKLDGKGLAPQAPRYTSMEKIKKAKTLSEVFGSNLK